MNISEIAQLKFTEVGERLLRTRNRPYGSGKGHFQENVNLYPS